MWPAILAGLALGGLKTIGDAQGNENDRAVAGATTRYAPWTGLKAGPIRKVSLLGNMMQGGMAGASAGMGMRGAPAASGALGSTALGTTGLTSSPWTKLAANPGLMAPDEMDIFNR